MLGLIFLGISVVVAIFMFQALAVFEMHWSLRVLLSTAPIAATFFFGIIGLFGSALVTGALFKAG